MTLFDVPLTDTVAPESSAPVLSFTTPDIALSWANNVVPANINTRSVSKRIFVLIV
jgi:hypothetical protein